MTFIMIPAKMYELATLPAQPLAGKKPYGCGVLPFAGIAGAIFGCRLVHNRQFLHEIATSLRSSQ